MSDGYCRDHSPDSGNEGKVDEKVDEKVGEKSRPKIRSSRLSVCLSVFVLRPLYVYLAEEAF